MKLVKLFAELGLMSKNKYFDELELEKVASQIIDESYIQYDKSNYFGILSRYSVNKFKKMLNDVKDDIDEMLERAAEISNTIGQLYTSDEMMLVIKK